MGMQGSRDNAEIMNEIDQKFHMAISACGDDRGTFMGWPCMWSRSITRGGGRDRLIISVNFSSRACPIRQSACAILMVSSSETSAPWRD